MNAFGGREYLMVKSLMWDEFTYYQTDAVVADIEDVKFDSEDQYSMVFYIEPEIKGEPKERATFVVRFVQGSMVVKEAYAVDSKGNRFGRRAAHIGLPELVANDDDVKSLSDDQKAVVLEFVRFYQVEEKAFVFQTIHGHIVHLARKAGTFVPGKEETAARLRMVDMVFLGNMSEDYQFRWVEMKAGSIQIGL